MKRRPCSSPIRIGLVLVVCLVALWVGETRAQVVALREVPDLISEPAHGRFIRERRELREAYTGLASEGRSFNGLCASVERGSANATKCRQWYGDLDAKRKTYSAKASAFNDRVARAITKNVKALEKEILHLRGRISRHQRALQNIGFETTAQQFEEYAERSAAGRMEAIRVLSKATIEVSFGLIGNAALTYRPVNPSQSTSLGHRLKGAGVTDPFVLRQVYNLHKMKPAAIKDFLSRLKAASLTVVAGATSHGQAETAAQVTLAVLAHFVKDNALAHRLALGELIAEGLVMGATYAEIRTGVTQMLKATEPQLQAMKPIQALLVTDVEALVHAKRDLARLKARP